MLTNIEKLQETDFNKIFFKLPGECTNAQRIYTFWVGVPLYELCPILVCWGLAICIKFVVL